MAVFFSNCTFPNIFAYLLTQIGALLNAVTKMYAAVDTAN